MCDMCQEGVIIVIRYVNILFIIRGPPGLYAVVELEIGAAPNITINIL